MNLSKYKSNFFRNLVAFYQKNGKIAMITPMIINLQKKMNTLKLKREKFKQEQIWCAEIGDVK